MRTRARKAQECGARVEARARPVNAARGRTNRNDARSCCKKGQSTAGPTWQARFGRNPFAKYDDFATWLVQTSQTQPARLG
jgi:hypothetical protein